MERENEIDYLKLKNFYKMLIDLGINISIRKQVSNAIKVDFNKKFTSVEEIDTYLNNFQSKNNFYPISRNGILLSNIFLISNASNYKNSSEYYFNESDIIMFEKMFNAVEVNSKNFFMINIDVSNKQADNTQNLIDFFIDSYLTILKPKIIIDMCTHNDKNSNKILKDYLQSCFIIHIPHPSKIILNDQLKKEAWTNLKLLRTKLNDI